MASDGLTTMAAHLASFRAQTSDGSHANAEVTTCSAAITIYAITKGADIFTGRGQYGACVMEVQLTATCPKTLIVTLGDVLESANAKNRVNLA